MLMENGFQLLLRIKCDHLYQFKYERMTNTNTFISRRQLKSKSNSESQREILENFSALPRPNQSRFQAKSGQEEQQHHLQQTKRNVNE